MSVKHTKHVRFKSYNYFWFLKEGWKLIEVVDDVAKLVKEY